MTTERAGAPRGGAPAQPSPDASRRARVMAVIPAAGRGERLGRRTPKALVTLGGRPVLVHAVHGLIASGVVDRIVVAAPAGELDRAERVLRPFRDRLPIDVIPGGDTRQRSVAAALELLGDPARTGSGTDDADDIVLVHDAARALTPPEMIATVVAAVRSGHDAVVPAVPLADTVKRVAPARRGVEPVVETLDRSSLRSVQTPQGFRLSTLVRAHRAADATATDDAGLVEAAGGAVAVVPGSPLAFKITTPWDLRRAEALLATSSDRDPGRALEELWNPTGGSTGWVDRP